MKNNETILIAGLGNPGSKYEKHRHNVGFMTIDAIAKHYNFSSWKNKFQTLNAKGTVANKNNIILAKPQNFMNQSGLPIYKILQYYKVKYYNLIVIHDEIDLHLGKIKFKTGGGNAGHNGLKSIAQNIGQEFNRLRIGIEHPGDKEMVVRHVLENFNLQEYNIIKNIITAICNCLPVLFEESAQNFINQTINQIINQTRIISENSENVV